MVEDISLQVTLTADLARYTRAIEDAARLTERVTDRIERAITRASASFRRLEAAATPLSRATTQAEAQVIRADAALTRYQTTATRAQESIVAATQAQTAFAREVARTESGVMTSQTVLRGRATAHALVMPPSDAVVRPEEADVHMLSVSAPIVPLLSKGAKLLIEVVVGAVISEVLGDWLDARRKQELEQAERDVVETLTVARSAMLAVADGTGSSDQPWVINAQNVIQDELEYQTETLEKKRISLAEEIYFQANHIKQKGEANDLMQYFHIDEKYKDNFNSEYYFDLHEQIKNLSEKMEDMNHSSVEVIEDIKNLVEANPDVFGQWFDSQSDTAREVVGHQHLVDLLTSGQNVLRGAGTEDDFKALGIAAAVDSDTLAAVTETATAQTKAVAGAADAQKNLADQLDAAAVSGTAQIETLGAAADATSAQAKAVMVLADSTTAQTEAATGAVTSGKALVETTNAAAAASRAEVETIDAVTVAGRDQIAVIENLVTARDEHVASIRAEAQAELDRLTDAPGRIEEETAAILAGGDALARLTREREIARAVQEHETAVYTAAIEARLSEAEAMESARSSANTYAEALRTQDAAQGLRTYLDEVERVAGESADTLAGVLMTGMTEGWDVGVDSLEAIIAGFLRDTQQRLLAEPLTVLMDYVVGSMPSLFGVPQATAGNVPAGYQPAVGPDGKTVLVPSGQQAPSGFDLSSISLPMTGDTFGMLPSWVNKPLFTIGGDGGFVWGSSSSMYTPGVTGAPSPGPASLGGVSTSGGGVPISGGQLFGAGMYGISGGLGIANGQYFSGAANLAAGAMMLIPGAQPFAPFVALGGSILEGVFGSIFAPTRPHPSGGGHITVNPDGTVSTGNYFGKHTDLAAQQAAVDPFGAFVQQIMDLTDARLSGALDMAISADDGEFRLTTSHTRVPQDLQPYVSSVKDGQFIDFTTMEAAQSLYLRHLGGALEDMPDASRVLQDVTPENIETVLPDLSFVMEFDQAIEAMTAGVVSFSETARGQMVAGLKQSQESIEEFLDSTTRLMPERMAEADAAVKQSALMLVGLADAATTVAPEIQAFIGQTEGLRDQFSAVMGAAGWTDESIGAAGFASLAEAETEAVRRSLEGWLETVALTHDGADALAEAFGDIPNILKMLADEVEQSRADLERTYEQRYARATGTPYLNLSGVADQYAAALEEAAGVGLDAAVVTRTYTAEIAALVDEMSAADITALIDQYQGVDVVVDGLHQALVAVARADVLAAYEAERSALEDLEETMRGYVDSLRSFRLSLMTDPGLSPLTATQRLTEAQVQYQDVLARAKLGDTDAMAALESLSRTYLEAANEVYSTASAQYVSVFDEVISSTQAVESVAERHARIAAEQLATAEDQLVALGLINDNVVSGTQTLTEALAALEAAVSAAAAAGGAGGGTGGGSQGGGASGGGGLDFSQGNFLSRAEAYLANNADVNAAIANGMYDHLTSSREEAALLHWRDFGQHEGRAFAAGGLAPPGWALVGEEGPELVDFHAPARVYTAEQTRAALGGVVDLSGLTAELRALRQENAVLQRQVLRLLAASGETQAATTARVARAAEATATALREQGARVA
ncbi:hypothetical protein [Roseospira visakhapatnamensis]|uniref:Uncharacterized protein n=1 Tax=Roseospira visakhapatnamensis TaxID=390880 RepID=A0A7W6RAY1_9PROT|nr:hypothetical protein [Roseospira visakhapatnamensis]MBB4265195.1 hypothetical protein [Roseospira visakhapatnamensis]